MPKPSSVNKKTARLNENDAARKSPVPGTRESSNKSTPVAAEKKPSASRKASRNSGSAAERLSNSSAATECVPVSEVTHVANLGARVSIGTALCEAGFDERAVAMQYVNVVQNLAQPSTTDRGGATKLLVDVLKECSRQLDSTAGHRSADAPVIVQLVHTVARPMRADPALTSANPPAAIEIAAPSAPDSAVEIESTNPSTEPS
jgi:hypothetical protein